MGVTAVVRVWLADGCSREDIGYGKAEGVKSKGDSLDKVRRVSISQLLPNASVVQERGRNRCDETGAANVRKPIRQLLVRQNVCL